MTSHKSLNKKKGAGYSFITGITTALIPAVIQALLLSVFTAGLSLATFETFKKDLSLPGETKKITDIIKYIILSSPDQALLCIAVIAIMSIFTGILLFKFSSDKKTVNVYYSLGIKRRSLFLSKYFAGAVMLTLSVILPIVLCFAVNLAYVGLSIQLSLTLLFFFFGLWAFSLLCYTVTACVFSCVGTVSESIVYSAGLLGFVTAFLIASGNIISAVFKKDSISQYFVPFYENGIYGGSSDSLLENFLSVNPLLFFYRYLRDYSYLRIDGDALILNNTNTKWTFPNFSVILPWLLVSVALTVLACFLFTKRKAENCGFLNTNKILSNLFIFEVCLFAACLPLQELRWAYDQSEQRNVFIMAALLTLFAYIICEIFIKRNFKKIIKTFYKLVAHVAVIAIVAGVVSSAYTAYRNYIPDQKKIVSAAVTSPTSLTSLTIRDNNYGNLYYCDLIKIPEFQYTLLEMPELTEKEDIAKVMELHKKLIENDDPDAELKVNIGITYTLKSGTKVQKTFSISDMDIVRECLGYYETEASREAIRTLLTKEYNYTPKNVNWDDAEKMLMTYDYCILEAFTSSLSEQRDLTLTKEEFAKFKNAVMTDLLAQSADDFYTTDKKQLGVITMSFDGNKFYGYEDASALYPQTVYEDITEPPTAAPESEYYDDTTEMYGDDDTDIFDPDGDFDNLWDDEPIPEEPIPEVSEPEKPKNPKMSDLSTKPFDMDYNYSNAYVIFIDEGMTNTLGFLNEIGCGDCFKSERTVKSISFMKCNFRDVSNYTTPSLEFIGANMFDMLSWSDDKPEDMIYASSENVITDKDKIAQLEPLMKLHYYTYGDGFWCFVLYDNGQACVKYLPASSAPAFVRNHKYVKSNNIY